MGKRKEVLIKYNCGRIWGKRGPIGRCPIWGEGPSLPGASRKGIKNKKGGRTKKKTTNRASSSKNVDVLAGNIFEQNGGLKTQVQGEPKKAVQRRRKRREK